MHSRNHRRGWRPRLTAALMLTFGTWANPIEAQQVQGGPTSAIIGGFVRGVDTAGDSHGNFLVVGGQGTVIGVCLNAQGAPITGGIAINVTPTGYASFPRAVFSQQLFGGAGGFMVVWAETPPGNPDAMRQLFARPVSCTGAVGPAQFVYPAVWWEPGNIAVGYSVSSQRFLIAWQTPEHTVAAATTNLAGSPTSMAIPISAGMGRDPSVAWSNQTNQFAVSYSGETYSALAMVPAWNPGAFTRNTFNVSGGIMTTMTDVKYHSSSGRFVMAWFEISSGAFAKIAEFDGAGNLLASGVASTRIGSYDALSMALNPVTGTFLLGGLNRANDTTLGLELNMYGYPFNGENTLSGTGATRYTRVSSSRVNGTWNVVFSGPNFGALSSLIATSFSGGGGPGPSWGSPAPTPTPPPPPPPPPPTGCPTVQPGPGWVCVSGNWLPPGSGGTPACPTVQPGPGWVCVNGNWLPPGSGGTPPPPPPPPPPPACPTVQPGPGWVCVNNNWLPPDMACPTIQPGPNWRCVNGNWLPPQ